jgi:hypothetical protein
MDLLSPEQTTTPSLAEEKSDQARQAAEVFASLESSVAASQANIATGKQGAMAAIETNTSAATVAKQSIDAVSAADEIIKSTKKKSELEAQNRNIELMQTAGGLDYQKQLMTQLTEESQRESKLLDERTAILTKEHTGIAIIDSIVNAFSVLPNSYALSAVQSEKAGTEGQIAAVTAAQERFASVNAKTVQIVNEGTIKATQDKIVAQATYDKAQIDMKTVASNAAMFNQVISLDARATETYMDSLKIQNEQRAMGIREKEYAVTEQKLAVEMELLPDTIANMRLKVESNRQALNDAIKTSPSTVAAKIANNEASVRELERSESLRATLITDYNAGRAMQGLPPEPEEVAIDNLYSKDLNVRGTARSFIMSAKTKQLGATAGAAYITKRRQDPANAGKQTKASTMLDEIAQDLEARYTAQPTARPTGKGAEAQYVQDFNNTAAVYVARESKVIKGPDSPFAAPPMESLKISLEGSNIPLYDKVVKKMGLQEANPQIIYDQALAAVQAKAINVEQAAQGLVDIYTAAAVMNNTGEYGFDRYGLPHQTSYVAPLKIVNYAQFPYSMKGEVEMFGSVPGVSGPVQNKIVNTNLMNLAEVRLLLVKQLMNAPAVKSGAAPMGTANTPSAKIE